jgi:hypothetical protein
MKLHSINSESRLYVMPCGDGYSCYGFDVLDRIARGVAKWANVRAPAAEPGTREHFEHCADILDYGARYAEKTRTRCNAELCAQLVGLEGRRVEVVDCYGERRRFKVGKSTGWLPIHLELASERSSGGIGAMGAPFKSVRVIK